MIGIAGGSGSGKTTFVEKLKKLFSPEKLSVLHMDSYYLSHQPDECITKTGKANYDHPRAFDWPLLTQHLEMLQLGENVASPVYDFKISKRSAQTTQVGAAPVILFEGIFSLFDDQIRSMLDIKCFLNVDSDIRFSRRLHRDVNERGRSLESVISQYYETVRPMYQKYLDPQKKYADFLVGEETDVAANILAAKIREFTLGEIFHQQSSSQLEMRS